MNHLATCQPQWNKFRVKAPLPTNVCDALLRHVVYIEHSILAPYRFQLQLMAAIQIVGSYVRSRQLNRF